MNKLTDFLHKSTAYLSLPFAYRRSFFLLWRLILTQRALTSELMRLTPHRKWLQSLDIRTVIDVGSFTGAFAFAVRQMLPGAQIFSFEPLPDSHTTLVKNLERFGSFRAFQTALGNSRGEQIFWRNDFAASSSVLPMSSLHKTAFPQSAHSVKVKVPLAKLDDFIPEMRLAPRVLLKLDVQGYELEVLRGGLRILRGVDYILTEVSFRTLYKNGALFPEIYAYLHSRGFDYAGSLETLASPLDGSIIQADALFIRQGK